MTDITRDTLNGAFAYAAQMRRKYEAHGLDIEYVIMSDGVEIHLTTNQLSIRRRVLWVEMDRAAAGPLAFLQLNVDTIIQQIRHLL